MAQEIAVERMEAPKPVSFLREQARAVGMELDFDPDFLVHKYKIERDKRQTSSGLEQYRLTQESALKGFLKDPYSDPTFKRDAISAKYEVLIVGGGFSGLQVAARLMEKGITNIAIIEKGDGFGGTCKTIAPLFHDDKQVC